MDWLSEEEERNLIKGMDEMPWDISQSGRRKQVNKIAISLFSTFNVPHVSTSSFYVSNLI